MFCISEHANWMSMSRKHVRDLQWCCLLFLVESVVNSESFLVKSVSTINEPSLGLLDTLTTWFILFHSAVHRWSLSDHNTCISKLCLAMICLEFFSLFCFSSFGIVLSCLFAWLGYHLSKVEFSSSIRLYWQAINSSFGLLELNTSWKHASQRPHFAWV